MACFRGADPLLIAVRNDLIVSIIEHNISSGLTAIQSHKPHTAHFILTTLLLFFFDIWLLCKKEKKVQENLGSAGLTRLKDGNGLITMDRMEKNDG